MDRIWRDGLDLSLKENWDATCAALGLDPDRAVDLINAAETKAKLRANTDAAVAAKLFGVPTLQIGDELFWGADALPMARAYLDDPAHVQIRRDAPGRNHGRIGLATGGCAMTRKRAQHFSFFCSRSTAVLTPADARGYLRVTSPKAAQAASFSFKAASDCPSRNSESGALADFSYLLVTLRKISAASRYCWRWKIALAEPVLGIADQRDRSDISARNSHGLFGERVVLALHVADAEVVFVARRVRRRRGGEAAAGAVGIARRRSRQGLRRAALRHGGLLLRRCALLLIARSDSSSGSPGPRPPGGPTEPPPASASVRRRAPSARRARSGSGWDRRHRHGGRRAGRRAPGRSARGLRSAAADSPAGAADSRPAAAGRSRLRLA